MFQTTKVYMSGTRSLLVVGIVAFVSACELKEFKNAAWQKSLPSPLLRPMPCMMHDVSWCSVLTNFTTTLNDGVFCPKGSQKGLTQWRSARFLQSQIVHSSTLWGWLCGIIDWGCHWRNRARTPHDHSCLTASMLRHSEAVRQGKKTTWLEKFCLFVLFLSGQTLALQVLTIGASASHVQNGTCDGTIWDLLCMMACWYFAISWRQIALFRGTGV